MSYLVLARKWRPQSFAAIVGQEHVTRTLTNAIGAGRIHHAFLFTGARGVGKTTAARILAKALCCEQGPTATPCNECDLCREITAGNAVDVQEIDGASNNSVDEVRQLRENVKYQPARARRKIFIIDEVHMLSGSAFNALLKTLEEPPPHVTFIFATTEPHKIPITILSRCQRYDFKLIPTAQLEQHLANITDKEKLAITPGARAAIAREAAGSVRDALSLLDQMVAYAGDATMDEALVASVLGIADRSVLFELSQAVLARDPRAALTILAQVFERGADLGQFARSFAGHLRDLHVTQVCGGDPSDLVEAASGDLEELIARAAKAPRGLLGQLFERMSRAVDEVARAPLPRHALEAALIDLCHAEPVVPLGDLLARLEELEARLGGGTRAAVPPRSTGGGSERPAPARPAAAPPRGSRAVPSAPAAAARSTAVSTTRLASGSPPGATTRPAPGAPPPAAAPPAPGELAGRWAELVNRVESQDPPLWGIIAVARPVSWTAAGLTLAFNSEAEADLARSSLDRLQRASGARVSIEVGVAAAKTVQSVAQSDEHKRREERDRRRREAREHPAYRDAMEVFRGATEKDIKTDVD
jgi:DNA polymerase-3 subunit gamma/tau